MLIVTLSCEQEDENDAPDIPWECDCTAGAPFGAEGSADCYETMVACTEAEGECVYCGGCAGCPYDFPWSIRASSECYSSVEECESAEDGECVLCF